MLRRFTLEYRIDDGWCVGRIKEVPGVFSQGESMEELEDNIRDAYQMMFRSWPVPKLQFMADDLACSPGSSS